MPVPAPIQTADPTDGLLLKCFAVRQAHPNAALIFDNQALEAIQRQGNGWEDGQRLLTHFSAFLDYFHTQTGAPVFFVAGTEDPGYLQTLRERCRRLISTGKLPKHVRFLTLNGGTDTRSPYDYQIPTGISFYSCPEKLAMYGMTITENSVFVLPSDARLGKFFETASFDPARPDSPQQQDKDTAMTIQDLKTIAAFRESADITTRVWRFDLNDGTIVERQLFARAPLQDRPEIPTGHYEVVVMETIETGAGDSYTKTVTCSDKGAHPQEAIGTLCIQFNQTQSVTQSLDHMAPVRHKTSFTMRPIDLRRATLLEPAAA